jgi:hypothetical protein
MIKGLVELPLDIAASLRPHACGGPKADRQQQTDQ